MSANVESSRRLRGSCLCGVVSYEIAPPWSKFAHCHCERCRKATGAAHASNVYLAPSQLTWLSGSESIARFDLASAPSFAKWFCGHCGSPVPRLSRSGRTVVVPAGSLDDELDVPARGRIFCASAARWACEGDSLPRYAEYPDWW